MGYNGQGEQMTDKEIKIKALQTIKEAVDSYALAFDPCDMCEHQDKTIAEHFQVCRKCCYYYASQFEPNRNNVKE